MGREACERNGGWEEKHFPLVSGACNVKKPEERDRGRGRGGERGALYRVLGRVGDWRKRFV